MNWTRLVAIPVIVLSPSLLAQDNYEIQVYPSTTLPKGMTMLEIHSNYTVQGTRFTADSTLPTHHAWHETLEITHGWNSWSETGFYLFSSAGSSYGWEFVGTHIRPRVRAPESWHLPVGLSLSSEFGYQRRQFSADTWTVEVRPIIDKELGRWYLCFNPTVGRSIHGDNAGQGWGFSPNGKFSYAFHKRISGGLEYYGSLGPLIGFDALRNQEQQIMPAIDVDFGPQWEFNLGVGIGLTGSTDHLIVKMIIGRRFGGGK